MKTLMFDFENGSKTLGSESDIEKMFGYPVMRPTSWRNTKRILGQIWTKKTSIMKKRLGDAVINESCFKFVPKNGTVDTLVFDTATESIKQFVRELRGNERMTLQMWGDLKGGIDSFLQFLNQLPCNVIINVHSKPMKDDDLGIIKYTPNVEGSSREDMGKFFDFVFYSKVKTDDDGNRSYLWVTARDERYDQAKDRTQLLEPEIPQDFQRVMQAAKKRGWSNIKVLVIGQPGSGKTLSLKTLNGKEVDNEDFRS